MTTLEEKSKGLSISVSILGITVFVQFFYYLYFFSRLLWYRPRKVDASFQYPSVSVIVCAHNEKQNLQILLPALLNQQYQDFEVIVVDDRSTDGSYTYFSGLYKDEHRFRMIRVESSVRGKNPKKSALTKGIEEAKNDWILLTDADCYPATNRWISSMASMTSKQKQLVLGFSPYEERNSFINLLIQYETLYTAVQYFSFAMAGLPYMAVGRNVLYKKTLFVHNNGFSSHDDITGGDDDLFVREVATKENVACNLNQESFVYSKPKESITEWLVQKRRHLSVGIHYKWKHKITLGVQLLAHIGFYVMLFFAFKADTKMALIFLMIRSLGFMLIFVLIARKLSGINKRVRLLLFVDVVFIFTYLLITASLVLYKRIKWN